MASKEIPAASAPDAIGSPTSRCPFRLLWAHTTTNSEDKVSLPVIPLEQFLANDGKEGRDTWILIDSIVFNVTNYLTKHPGGKIPLLQGSGRDSTLQFYRHHGRKGNTRPLFNRLRSLAIGRIDKSELSRVPEYQEIDTETCGNPALRQKFLQMFDI